VLLRIVEFLLIEIFFLRYCALKSYSVYILGWYLYIYAIWIAIFAFVILGHPIDSRHNTTFFLELTGSNIFLWCYFWIDFCLNLFRNMSSSGSQHSVRQKALWKTNCCWSRMFKFQRSQDLDELFPSSCRAFRSILLQICTSLAD
jgi:hypothetical protein